MSDQLQPGPLIATGRAADVFAYGDKLVLRRYRTPHDCSYEAAIMQHVHAHGYPVPKVIEFAGGDLVMERVDGPTMLDDFGRRPWRLYRHAATLAALLEQLHEIPAPDWLRDRHAGPERSGGGSPPRRHVLVHLDLHPDNVMLTSRGPVVIDWTNAGRGDPDAEIADLWLVFTSAVVPGGAIRRALINAGRGLFVKAFLRHFDRDEVRRKLAVAAEHRSRDRNMSEAEKEKMRALVERFEI